MFLAGGWIFNTEAHPIDPGSLYCCSQKRSKDETLIKEFKDNIDFVSLLDLSDPFLKNLDLKLDEVDLHEEVQELKHKEEDPEDVERELQELQDKFYDIEEIHRRAKEEENQEDEHVDDDKVKEDSDVKVKQQSSIFPVVDAQKPEKRLRKRRRSKGKRKIADLMGVAQEEVTEDEERKRVKSQVNSILEFLAICLDSISCRFSKSSG